MCLALLTFEHETTQGVVEQILFSYVVAGVHRKSFSKMFSLIGDNCHTNKSKSIKMSFYLYNCSSYGFRLAVSEIILFGKQVIAQTKQLI